MAKNARALPLVLALFFLSFMPKTSQAHVYLELRVVVNVLPGASITDSVINARMNSVNTIYSQCGNIAFTVTKINRLAAWPANFGNRNDSLDPNVTNAALRAASNAEIQHGGYKIWVAKGFYGATGTRGFYRSM